MRRVYICVLIVFAMSCKSAPDLKSYGVISSEVDSIPTIDTSNNIVRPVTLAARQYHLTNKSTNHNINFILNAYLKGDGKALLEKKEKHAVAPQETINLDIDSNNNRKLLNYKIVSAIVVD